MPKGPVQFKPVGPGCTVEVRPLSPSDAEQRLIGHGPRRPRPSAGLTVNSSTAFPVGALVVLDLKFQGQVFTYRSRGIVSWVAATANSDLPYKLGVLVYGMDKLDANGLSVSLAPASPFAPSLTPEPPSALPLAALAPTVALRPSSLPRPPATGALVTLFAVDPKVSRWLESPRPPVEAPPPEILAAPGKEPAAAVDTLCATALPPFGPEDEPPEEGTDDAPFDAEHGMTDAFLRLHELYGYAAEEDAASFVLTLARELIACESGGCTLVGRQHFELYTAAQSGYWSVLPAPPPLPLGKGLIGASVRRNQVVCLVAPASDPRYLAAIDSRPGETPLNMVIAPVHSGGQTLGALQLIDSPRRCGFVAGEANVLSYLANGLAEYLDTMVKTRDIH